MKRILSGLLSLLLLTVSVSAKEECVRCEALGRLGFPPSYREALCAILKERPNFHIEPLLITALSREAGLDYTFPFVLEEELKEERSLVSAFSDFAPYGEAGTGSYDRGYQKATEAAVSYFLDPRGHLSEKGIFQFLLLSFSPYDEAVIGKVLMDSSLEGVVLPSYLLEVGEKTGVDPVHLAVRLRQEQGQKGTPLLTGKAGDYLTKLAKKDLSSFNGYFNPFHVRASGNGDFAVYENGARFAKESGWDSLEKGILGGAEKLGREYISRFQNTLYLQKWNVDVRSRTDTGESRNFWAQYMQNIGAAKTEGDQTYRVYEEMGLLSLPLHFLIPVYEEMPEIPSPDPSGGSVFLFAAAPLPSAAHLYEETEVFWEEENHPPTISSISKKEKKNGKKLDILMLFPALFCYMLGKFKKYR